MASQQYLLLVVLLLGGSTIINIHAQPRGFDPNFSGLVTKIFDEFKEAAMDGGFNQFAVVVMVTPQQMVNWDLQFYPRDDQGHPRIDWGQSLSPQQKDDYNNFIVATPRNNVHSEAQILPHIEQLRNRFLSAHGPIGAIILYSYYAPCQDCTNRIIQYLGGLARNVQTAVLYSSPLRGVNEDDAQQQILDAGMDFAKFDNCRHNLKRVVANKCSCVSLQDYLLCSLGQEICCCVARSSCKAAVADFINRIMAECSSKLKNLESCSRETVLKLTGGAVVV